MKKRKTISLSLSLSVQIQATECFLHQINGVDLRHDDLKSHDEHQVEHRPDAVNLDDHSCQARIELPHSVHFLVLRRSDRKRADGTTEKKNGYN